MVTLAGYWGDLTKEDRELIIEQLEDHGYFKKITMATLMFVPVEDVVSVLANYPRSRRFREAQERNAPSSICNSILALDVSKYDRIISIIRNQYLDLRLDPDKWFP